MPDVPAFVGRYEILRLLGRGGMGAVYLAQDPAINRKVAIKFLGDRIDDDELRVRFAREARAAGGLRHPNIVTIFDIGEQDARPFIVMEHVPGETLADLIRRKAPLTLVRKLQIVEELCAGLAHAHAAGVIHRDVKPSNIIVDESGVVKILDFGIAKAGETGVTKPGAIPGTLNYMPPELIMGGPLDKRADTFAVGAVLYELLAYRQAFPGTFLDGVFQKIAMGTPATVDGLDREIEDVIGRAIAKRPDDRFADLSEMQSQLARIRRRVEASEATMLRPRPSPQPAPYEAETELAVGPMPTPRPAPDVSVAQGVSLPSDVVMPQEAQPAQDVPVPEGRSVRAEPPAAGNTLSGSDARLALDVRDPEGRETATETSGVGRWNVYWILGGLGTILLIMWNLSSPAPTDQQEASSTSSAVTRPESTLSPGDRKTSRDGREMVWIPPGDFQMGSPESEFGIDKTELHSVRIARGFWLDVTEVTNQAYQRFLRANPDWQKSRISASFQDGDYLKDWSNDIAFPVGKATHPVAFVSWSAARTYCSWAGKRLPAEAEWEYAARAGTSTAYWWGNAFDATRANANLQGTVAVDDPRHVNPWGLADMLGNVWEWTSTIYRPYPYRADDGRENPSSASARAVRGGGWGSVPSLLRAAIRNRFVPAYAGISLGFRCAQ